MLSLFPEIQPYAVHSFAVEPPHVLHVEECGNRDGLPVLFLHGGPGAGFQSWNRRFFDPERYRIVLFDQRGAGRSTPHAPRSKAAQPRAPHGGSRRPAARRRRRTRR